MIVIIAINIVIIYNPEQQSSTISLLLSHCMAVSMKEYLMTVLRHKVTISISPSDPFSIPPDALSIPTEISLPNNYLQI